MSTSFVSFRSSVAALISRDLLLSLLCLQESAIIFDNDDDDDNDEEEVRPDLISSLLEESDSETSLS